MKEKNKQKHIPKIFLVVMMVATMISICFALPQSVHAIQLYDNGPSTHTGGSAIGHFIAADDFVLDSDAVITGASVDVHDGPESENRRWDGTVEWWIIDDNGGAPGNVIASGFGQNIRQSNLIISPSGFRDFSVDFDFGQDIPITAGEMYWLALHFQADYSRMSVFWDHTASVRNSAAYSGGELVGGSPDFTGKFGGPSRFDKAFRLFGELASKQPELCPDEYRWGPAPSWEWDPCPDTFVGRQEVHFVNNGPGDAYNVTATVTCVPINVVATDPDVTLGDIPAGSSAWSSDTFELRVDMTNPQNPNKGICWRVEYDDAAGVHHTIEDVAKYCGEECSAICP